MAMMVTLSIWKSGCRVLFSAQLLLLFACSSSDDASPPPLELSMPSSASAEPGSTAGPFTLKLTTSTLGSVSWSATSSNPWLLPQEAISINDAADPPTLSVSVQPERIGDTVITVRAAIDGRAITADLLLQVRSSDPLLPPLSDQDGLAGADIGPIFFRLQSDAGNDPPPLRVTAADGAMLSATDIRLQYFAGVYALTLRPQQSGTTTVTVAVDQTPVLAKGGEFGPAANQGLDAVEFSIAVLPPPTVGAFTVPAMQTVLGRGDLFLLGDLQTPSVGSINEQPNVAVLFSENFQLAAAPVTNGQYMSFLNWALGQGFITLDHPRIPTRVLLAAADPRSGAEWDPRTLVFLDRFTQILWQYDEATGGGQFVLRDVPGHRDGDIASREHHPMVQVTWFGAMVYCWAMNEQFAGDQIIDLRSWNLITRIDEAQNPSRGYRLPNEAEWEYAARGGWPNAKYPWWSADPRTHIEPQEEAWDVANFGRSQEVEDEIGGWPYTRVVGSYPANGYALFDMAGNVWEWCHDWFVAAQYTHYSLIAGGDAIVDPRGPDPDSGTGIFGRSVRGGGWYDTPYHLRCSLREGYAPTTANYGLGFRPLRWAVPAVVGDG